MVGHVKYSSVNGVGHINFEQQTIAQCKVSNHVVDTSLCSTRRICV